MKAGAIGQVMTSKRVTDLEEDKGIKGKHAATHKYEKITRKRKSLSAWLKSDRFGVVYRTLLELICILQLILCLTFALAGQLMASRGNRAEGSAVHTAL